jgi:hypothetical protein
MLFVVYKGIQVSSERINPRWDAKVRERRMVLDDSFAGHPR